MRPTEGGLRVLFLEDDPADAELVEHALRRALPGCTLLRVDGSESFRRACDEFQPNVVLSDHAVSEFNAFDALRVTQVVCPASPFLVVAGAFEATIGECLKHGAFDFVFKSDLSRLAATVSRALEVRAPLRGLSKRQLEVMQLLVAGKSMNEIANELHVSVKTVESHRALVLKKLNVRDLPALIRYAARIGFIPTES